LLGVVLVIIGGAMALFPDAWANAVPAYKQLPFVTPRLRVLLGLILVGLGTLSIFGLVHVTRLA